MAHFAFEQQLSEAVGVTTSFNLDMIPISEQVRMDSSINLSSSIRRQSLKPNNAPAAGLNRSHSPTISAGIKISIQIAVCLPNGGGLGAAALLEDQLQEQVSGA